jgi:hypothetical protein
MLDALQSNLFADQVLDPPPPIEQERSGTFTDNMRLPVHRWFRYSAGFSAEWVRSEIEKLKSAPRVFDPFAGSGTTLLASEFSNATSLGQEAHPFIIRVAKAKLQWRSDIKHFVRLAEEIQHQTEAEDPSRDFPVLLEKCYEPAALTSIERLRKALIARQSEEPAWELVWLAFVAIIRSSSRAGTAQWQYVLPKKSKVAPQEPILAFRKKVFEIASDMHALVSYHSTPLASVLQEDCREPGNIPSEWADLVVTSPPYINNYDYADATRLEMTVLGEIAGWSDLQEKVRTNLVRSCTQHVAPYAKATRDILSDPLLLPIAYELTQKVVLLDEIRHERGGKKNYHAMVAHYFLDMAKVWIQLRRIARPGGKVCFVIGDSAPYGIHIPVEKWMAELAVAAGFKNPRFEKIRDRNTKWKNRKHRVPLCEGRLWIDG